MTRSPSADDASAIAKRRDSSTVENGRVPWWDRLKDVAIAFIVAGHVAGALRFEGRVSGAGLRPVLDGMLLGALASFYVAAGAFLPRSSRRSFGKFFVAKFVTLMVPYVAWTVIQGGTESALARLVTPERSFSSLLATLWFRPYWQFWFLYVLFLASLFAWLLAHARLANWMIGLIAVGLHAFIVCDGSTARRLDGSTGWGVSDRLFADFIFVAIGMIGGQSIARLGEQASALRWSIVGAAALLLWICSERTGVMRGDPFVTGAFGLIVVAALALLARHVGLVDAAVQRMGRDSIIIFTTHVFIMGGCKVLLTRELPDAPAVVHLVLRVGLAIGLPLIAVEIWRRLRASRGTKVQMFALDKDAAHA